jgi:hypothetical protein
LDDQRVPDEVVSKSLDAPGLGIDVVNHVMDALETSDSPESGDSNGSFGGGGASGEW